VEEGIGIGEKSTLSGTDLYTFLLSKDGTDLPTYTDQWSDDIARSIASICGVTLFGEIPHYKIDECDAKEGKGIDHLGRLFHDGGCGFKVVKNGLMVMKLDAQSGSGIGSNWMKTVKRSRNIADKVTSIKIVKTSKVQTHYEFVFQEEGQDNYLKQVDFAAPMVSVTVDDNSLIGYVDEVAFFNGPVASGGQIGPTLILHPDHHPGVTFPPGGASGPIKSASFNIYPPEDSTTGEIYAVVSFDGVPQQSAFRNDIELSFDTTYDTGETPARPASDYIDGSLMPTKAHADSIAPALLFDRNKGAHTMDFASDDPIPIMEPCETIPWRSKSGRIEHLTVSRAGFQANCSVI
jgi:hypothetical protein